MPARESLYVSVARLRVAPERVDELVTAFGRRADLVDGAPGFVDLELLELDQDADGRDVELGTQLDWLERLPDAGAGRVRA